MIRRLGATWVHFQREDDTATTFVHALCGLTFTRSQTTHVVTGDVTCPSCLELRAVADRTSLTAPVEPWQRQFRPRTGEIAAAWAGPKVEVCTTILGQDVTTTVFIDGQEVPCMHVTEMVVDPGAGWTERDWQAATRNVTGDVTLSPAFRDMVVSERDTAREADRGRTIIGRAQ